jgi:hypothetical protein
MDQERSRHPAEGNSGQFALKFQTERNTTLASDSLHSLAARGIVRPEFIATLLDEHLPAHPGYYGEMVWILMMLEQWLRGQRPSIPVLDP